MTSRQENKLNMYLAVTTFLNTNVAIVNRLPMYGDSLSSLNTGITNIKALAKEQMFDKSGVHKNKKQLKYALAGLAADTSRKLVTFAKFTNNQPLLSEIDFSESKLKYANNSEIRDYTQGIYSRAQTHIADLEIYGVTANTQAALLAAINEFTDYSPQTRIVSTSGKRYTTEIAEAFKKADIALENIDAGIEIIKLSELYFYKEYKSVRKIISLGTGSLALTGKITDAITKEPIKNASIEFNIKVNGSNTPANTNGTIYKKSADKGGFFIKTMPNGLYDVSISKNGYTGKNEIIVVSTGELARLNIELVMD